MRPSWHHRKNRSVANSWNRRLWINHPVLEDTSQSPHSGWVTPSVVGSSHSGWIRTCKMRNWTAWRMRRIDEETAKSQVTSALPAPKPEACLVAVLLFLTISPVHEKRVQRSGRKSSTSRQTLQIETVIQCWNEKKNPPPQIWTFWADKKLSRKTFPSVSVLLKKKIKRHSKPRVISLKVKLVRLTTKIKQFHY